MTVGARVLNHEDIPVVNGGHGAVHRKFVVVLAERSHHIDGGAGGSIFLAQHGDMVVSPIHGRTHEVAGGGVHADIFLIDVLFSDGGGQQIAVWPGDVAPHLHENRQLHTG